MKQMGNMLPSIPGGWTETTVPIRDREFRLHVPARPDDFLEDPTILQASDESGYMPYWPYLWGSAPTMSRLVLEADWQHGTRALEIGSGIGLVGLAGLAAGLDVTFSDYDANSVQLALTNAQTNGFGNTAGLVFDWRNLNRICQRTPHTNNAHQGASQLEHFPVILGCDVIYEPQIHEPILNVLDRFLTPDGLCWLADPGRSHADAFIERARRRGYRVSIKNDAGTETAAPLINQFQMLTLQQTQ
jgi:predicted nicotinamide N-methyase